MPRALALCLDMDRDFGFGQAATLAFRPGTAGLRCPDEWLQVPSPGLFGESLEPRSRIAVEHDRWHIVA